MTVPIFNLEKNLVILGMHFTVLITLYRKIMVGKYLKDLEEKLKYTIHLFFFIPNKNLKLNSQTTDFIFKTSEHNHVYENSLELRPRL